MRQRYIAALQAADDHDSGPLLAFARSWVLMAMRIATLISSIEEQRDTNLATRPRDKTADWQVQRGRLVCIIPGIDSRKARPPSHPVAFGGAIYELIPGLCAPGWGTFTVIPPSFKLAG